MGHTRRVELWSVIDERWNNTLHRPIHVAGLYLNHAFSYACGFQFHVEVMDGILHCVQRKVLTPSKCAEISRQMEIYRMSGGTFGYDMVVQDRTTRMPGTICLKLSNFDLLDS